MRTRPCSRPLRGFTLVELALSAALMSMILAAAYLCLREGYAGQKEVESRADVIQEARVALAMMSADLRAACPLSPDVAFLGAQRTLDKVEADNLDFATHHYSPRRLREGDFCEVSYFLDRGPGSSSGFSLWRRRNPTLALDPLAGGSREEIIPGVRGLKFEYYDGLEWYANWGDVNGRRRFQNPELEPDNLSGMPEAVRITLWLDPGRSTSASATGELDTNTPPLVFQTVARLELADRPEGDTGSHSSTSAGGQPASQPNRATPNSSQPAGAPISGPGE
jgi:prepilin-type N-terminal cleavage/methylation domain-containing protein